MTTLAATLSNIEATQRMDIKADERDEVNAAHAEALKENFRRTLARNKARIEAETDAKHTLATWEHDGVTFYLTES